MADERGRGSSAARKNEPSSRDDFFLVVVWLQSPTSAPKYKAAGINLYVGLWNDPTDKQLAKFMKHDMPVICAQNPVGFKYEDDLNRLAGANSKQ